MTTQQPTTTPRTKVIVRYPNLSDAIVEVAASFDPNDKLTPVLYGAQCTGCLDFPRPLFRSRITRIRRWAAEHSTVCHALPQPDTDAQ